MPMEKSLLKDPHQNLTRKEEQGEDQDQSFVVSFENETTEVLKSVNTPSFMASLNTPFEAALVSSSPRPPPSFFDCFSNNKNKRVLSHEDDEMTKDDDDQESCVDRRHKRMMKNRESAARSRARRQAYTSELEMEIAELLEENAKLKKQQLQLLLSAPAGIPKKNTHNRSLTAPF